MRDIDPYSYLLFSLFKSTAALATEAGVFVDDFGDWVVA